MAKEIVFEELIKNFKLENGKLFRLFKEKYWKEVSLEVNTSSGYCNIGWQGKIFKAHRILYSLYHQCDINSSLFIDHISANRIDNSKENLRLVDNRENQSNQTEHRNGRLVGCYFNKQHNKWMAYIQINKKLYNLGNYPTDIEAHKTYLTALECLQYELTGPQIQNVVKELQKENCL